MKKYYYLSILGGFIAIFFRRKLKGNWNFYDNQINYLGILLGISLIAYAFYLKQKTKNKK